MKPYGDLLTVERERRDISPAAQSIIQGTKRLLFDHGYGALEEVSLGNGRRVDLFAISSRSDLVIIEVKSCLADWRADHKWQDYLPYCDRFFVAIDAHFPLATLQQDLEPHENVGIIMADQHGAEIIREARSRPLHTARRKALVSRYAFTAGRRFIASGGGKPIL